MVHLIKSVNLTSLGLEALLQSAQLKTMFGDLQGAMDLAARALPLARSRDEVIFISFAFTSNSS